MSPTNVSQDIKAPMDAETAYPPVTRQPDGMGKRAGSVAEGTSIAALNAAKFRECLGKYQADAWHYEALV